MKGASAEPLAKIRRAPRSRSVMKIGNNHHFLLVIRNSKHSRMIVSFFMMSKQMREGFVPEKDFLLSPARKAGVAIISRGARSRARRLPHLDLLKKAPDHADSGGCAGCPIQISGH